MNIHGNKTYDAQPEEKPGVELSEEGKLLLSELESNIKEVGANGDSEKVASNCFVIVPLNVKSKTDGEQKLLLDSATSAVKRFVIRYFFNVFTFPIMGPFMAAQNNSFLKTPNKDFPYEAEVS